MRKNRVKVLLFLKKTLNRKQFYGILMTRPAASNHYLNYLESRMKIAEATDLLTFVLNYKCKNIFTKLTGMNMIEFSECLDDSEMQL